MSEPTLLIGDIGGTNARLALATADSPGYDREMTLACANYSTPEEAIAEYLDRCGAGRPSVICLAAAGPVQDGRVRFTNNPWILDSKALAGTFSADAVRLLNDFEAVAHAIPRLGAADTLPVGGSASSLPGTGDFTAAVIGPGTGLGHVGVCRRQGVLVPVVSEAGHIGFSPQDALQDQVMAILRKRHPRVINEHLLSGPGLENLYHALGQVHGQSPGEIPASAICLAAEEQSDPLAVQALQLFFRVLGQVAGDVALAFGAWDGLYIAGGIVPRYSQMLQASDFRQAFEAKGVYRELMGGIPTTLITHPQPGLLGAGACALGLLASA